MVLLRHSPCCTYKLLKEVASEGDMMGLSGVSEEVVAVKLSHGHISALLISWCLLVHSHPQYWHRESWDAN